MSQGKVCQGKPYIFDETMIPSESTQTPQNPLIFWSWHHKAGAKRDFNVKRPASHLPHSYALFPLPQSEDRQSRDTAMVIFVGCQA